MADPRVHFAFMFNRDAMGNIVISWNPQAMEMDDLLRLLWSASSIFPQRAISVAILEMPDAQQAASADDPRSA